MSDFTVQNGQFLLDGKPVLIQAGEFHYYRTPREQWRHRLDLLKNAGFNSVASYIPWIWHQLEENVSDFDGHSHPMRDLEGFLDLAAEMGFFIIARPGPYIMAETINEGIPPWVFERYPQAAFISQDQKAQNIASYMQPDFLDCCQRWFQAIFGVLTPRQITRGGKIIMIQLDNEMGMMPWVRNIIDTNPDTIDRFAAYLKEYYGKNLSKKYPTTNLEEFLREGIIHPQDASAEQIVTDYRRFYRQYLKEYASFLLDTAKKYGMDVLPVINIHGFANGGKTFPIGISQLIDVMRLEGVISATDVYPGIIGEGNFHELLLVNEMTKALHHPEQALFSIEFQAGGCHDFWNNQSSLYDLHTRLCISAGMRAINHYLFCSGENDPVLSPVKRHDWGHPVRQDGTVRRHYYRYPKLSKVLDTYGKDLILAQPQTVTTIGFILDYFMTEVNNRFTQEATGIITHQRDVVLFDMLAKGLAITHRPFNAVELGSTVLDPASTPLCWVMMEKQCSQEIQQSLLDYAKNGGKLVLAGRMCIEDFDRNPCTLLREALRIQEINSDAPFARRDISVFNYRDVPVSFLETYTGEFDEVFAKNDEGETAGFIQSLGQGEVMVFGAAMPTHTLEDVDIVHQMGLRMGCASLFKLSAWADVRISRGENGSFLFINNYQDDPVETTIEYENQMLFGGKPLRLAARSGLILPLEWQLREDVLVHFITSEITSISEDQGTLQLTTQQDEFQAEMSLAGWEGKRARRIQKAGGTSRVRLQGKNGKIQLNRDQGTPE